MLKLRSLKWIKAVASGRLEPKPWEKAGYKAKDKKRV